MGLGAGRAGQGQCGGARGRRARHAACSPSKAATCSEGLRTQAAYGGEADQPGVRGLRDGLPGGQESGACRSATCRPRRPRRGQRASIRHCSQPASKFSTTRRSVQEAAASCTVTASLPGRCGRTASFRLAGGSSVDSGTPSPSGPRGQSRPSSRTAGSGPPRATNSVPPCPLPMETGRSLDTSASWMT